MSNARMVIFEGEHTQAETAAARLRKEGYEVQVAPDAREGLRWTRRETPDLVILDVSPRDMSAVEILRRLRKNAETIRTPVFLITRHDERNDRIPGLDMNVDDFITLPAHPSVLAARVDLLLRRFGWKDRQGDHAHRIGPITIDTIRHEAAVDGEPLKLTLTEFRLLSTLAEAKGRVLRRNQLIDQAIGMDAIVTDRTIDVHLTSLRRKLGPARRHLKTVRGVGYRVVLDENDDS
ncbi:MAG: response regulator transcription factor [Phycisphaerae bacterium]|nr:response regulator transcription factor [Phycisphaerae bacterium]